MEPGFLRRNNVEHASYDSVPHAVMILDMSDEEFERLMRLVSLGERISNDWTREEHWSDEQRANADLLAYLSIRSADARLDHLVDRHPETGEWIPSKELEDDAERLLQAYDEEVFWDELTLRLARRDLVGEYGKATLDVLSPQHRRLAEDAMIRYYEGEIADHGIERLMVEGERREGASTNRKLRHNPPKSSS